MLIRPAKTTDNDKLVELARLTPMHGTISICIQRQPDFFALLKKRGEPHVIVAEEDDKIIACFSVVKENMIMLNEPVSIHYMCDLKVHPDFRSRKIGTKIGEAMHQHLRDIDGDVLSCTVAEGNQRAMPFITGGKTGINGVTVGRFHILQLIPSKKNKTDPAYTYSEYNEIEDIITMYQQFSQRYALHPRINSEMLSGCIHFAAFENQKPVAVISLADTEALKQNVLIDFPWYFGLAVAFLRLTKAILSTPHLPRKGEAIRQLYVKYFSHLPGYENAFISLLSFAKYYAFNRKYSFLSIALHETDPLRKPLRKFKAFPFVSRGMMSSLKNNYEKIDKVTGKNVFEDFSLI